MATDDWQQHENVLLLTSVPVPALDVEQLARFSKDNLHIQDNGTFQVHDAVEALKAKEGQQALGADYGGDKGSTRLFVVKDGVLTQSEAYRDDIQGDNGKGYLASLERAAAYAESRAIPFGISWGGPLEAGRMEFHPKAEMLYQELNAAHDGDFTKISPSVTACLNDAPAGLISGAVEAYRQTGATTVLFPINGGGLGMGVLQDNTIYATEAGHVEGLEALNTYKQTTACGVFDQKHTCIEQLGSNKKGIEVQWQQETGAYMRARDIEDHYKEGDQLARKLYEHSALVVAHMIQGTAAAFNIDLTDQTVAVVCHGGAFKFPYYGERVQGILAAYNKGEVQLIMTKDYIAQGSNACLDGAAIAALTNK